MLRKITLFIVLFSIITALYPNGIEEGDILWQSQPIGENIEASTTIDSKGSIYVTGGGKLWCFNKDGKINWNTCPLDEGCMGVTQKYHYPLGVASSPAISPDEKRIYITGYAGIFAFQSSDGNLILKRTVFDNHYDFIKVTDKDFEESIVYLENYIDGKYAFSFQYYDREDGGNGFIEVRDLSWENGWPVVSNVDFFNKYKDVD